MTRLCATLGLRCLVTWQTHINTKTAHCHREPKYPGADWLLLPSVNLYVTAPNYSIVLLFTMKITTLRWSLYWFKWSSAPDDQCTNWFLMFLFRQRWYRVIDGGGRCNKVRMLASWCRPLGQNDVDVYSQYYLMLQEWCRFAGCFTAVGPNNLPAKLGPSFNILQGCFMRLTRIRVEGRSLILLTSSFTNKLFWPLLSMCALLKYLTC